MTRILLTAVGLSSLLLGMGCAAWNSGGSASMTREVMTAAAQKQLSPALVLTDLKEGNQRFVDGRTTPRDSMRQVEATSTGQYPKAVVLSCLDSRVPPELIFDQGIGDLFVGRIAGNFENVDMLGSLEFATKAAGAKLIVVLGHTACGAIKGAADQVELGNLTAMLDNFDPALARAREAVPGPANSKNQAFIQRAIEENVRLTMSDILARSPVVKEQVDSGAIGIVGGVYDLATGKVKWLDS